MDADPFPMGLWTRLGRGVRPWIGPAMFAAALAVLYHEFHELRPLQVLHALRASPFPHVAASLGFTAVSYLLISAYDLLAVRHVGLRLPTRRTLSVAFTAYAFTNSAGNSLITGTPIRYRLYSAIGVDSSDLVRIVLFGYLTFALGTLLAGGASLAAAAPRLSDLLPVPAGTVRAAGFALLALATVYVILVSSRPRTLRWRDWTFTFPGLSTTLLQILVATLDWVAACLALWILLPLEARPPFPAFLGVFVGAQALGLVSQVPGGLGVFETVVGLSLAGTAPASDLFGSLLVYRLVYYLLPLTAAAGILALDEYHRRKDAIDQVGQRLGDWISEVVPQVLAILGLVAGTLLLITGALPAPGSRLHWLGSVVPLPFVEASHFLGSLVGMGLILLARGLQRRTDAAWNATVLLLGFGAALALMREQVTHAVSLGLLLLLALPCRREFYRRTTLTRVAWSPGWVALVVMALAGTAVLVLFSYRQVEYSHELWWRFELDADAPRSMRAVIGAVALAGAFAVARLLRDVGSPPALPAIDEIDAAAAVAADSVDSIAHLALLGDKRLLFNADRTAFVMYGVEGRTWVSMGDPQGDEQDRADLAWRFREMVDRNGGIPAFYEIRRGNLGLYVDLGLGIHNIGENARVPLAEFSLQGGARKGLRRTVRHLEEREGCSFRVFPPAEVPRILPRLREVSDEWLAGKSGREKSFSLGSFREPYLCRLPAAVVERQGEIVAFANLWPGGRRSELSVDLMRYGQAAPTDTMEYLFTRLMLWGREQGFDAFNLGMAPLSGLEGRDLAPLHHRIGDLIFRHGEHFYHFQGLRQYKQKFDPVWEPRYVACPSLALPRVLVSVAALISRGIEGVLRK